MKKTVAELIEMIDNGTLKYDQSTQRKFIYTTEKKVTEDGEVSMAGNVIRSILQFNIQLPALYFWETEDGTYNIHDGKQRVLSLYYFINPSNEINVITRINGLEQSYHGLSPEQQQRLLNYEFDIVVNNGPQEEEENSFYLINTNSVELTPYEALRGMFYGPWIYQFEEYLQLKANNFDCIKKVYRGEQAILFIFCCFNLLDDKHQISNTRRYLREVRQNNFDANHYKLDETISLFAQIKEITKIKDQVALQVASYIINKNWDGEIVLDYYREKMRLVNDISSWKFETHKVAINQLIQYGIKCDGKRFFSSADKDDLYRVSQKCVFENCTESSYARLECDHIKAWSQGGPTILENAQLLCKNHNASKGADSDGFKG